MVGRWTLFLVIFSQSLFAQETELQFYRPFANSEKQIHPQVMSTFVGECSQQSQLITREDALQCKAAGKIFDPCFIKAYSDKKEAICPQSPWTAASVLIQFEKNLPQQFQALDMSRTYPWAVELSNGIKCQAFLNHSEYDHLPIRYFCSDKSTLLGHLQRCSSTWTILQHQNKPQIETVEIAKVWF